MAAEGNAVAIPHGRSQDDVSRAEEAKRYSEAAGLIMTSLAALVVWLHNLPSLSDAAISDRWWATVFAGTAWVLGLAVKLHVRRNTMCLWGNVLGFATAIVFSINLFQHNKGNGGLKVIHDPPDYRSELQALTKAVGAIRVTTGVPPASVDYTEALNRLNASIAVEGAKVHADLEGLRIAIASVAQSIDNEHGELATSVRAADDWLSQLQKQEVSVQRSIQTVSDHLYAMHPARNTGAVGVAQK
jgi:hypothetical protein